MVGWSMKMTDDLQKIKIHSLANRIKELTFWEVDELVEELKNISPTFPVLFQSALYENLKKRGDIK